MPILDFKEWAEINKVNEVNEVNESSEYKIYVIDDELWFAYGESSGMTANIKNKGYITDKIGDTNHDSIVSRIVTKLDEKPLVKKISSDKLTTYLLHRLPVYKYLNTKIDGMDVWGGTVKPNSIKYALLVVGEKYNIINLFDTQREAQAYIKSLA